ncbi:hypothetical protein P9272_32745 [Mesorhizobium sp. WSM4976]|uniref:hypothetical protein n=1 Tax=Mesorhizobium sp. WSM4976 TaxID=3038549 RepID=UPI0024165148|nr:hypothetical protein [Mesorhizobium sp. WSM4976]MDG4898304.1 hypothetical protein [Mesorhizobium sp. WSM4976]
MIRLIPTGRGSYVRTGSIALAELLRRYDLAKQAGPEFVSMSRNALILSYVSERGDEA